MRNCYKNRPRLERVPKHLNCDVVKMMESEIERSKHTPPPLLLHLLRFSPHLMTRTRRRRRRQKKRRLRRLQHLSRCCAGYVDGDGYLSEMFGWRGFICGSPRTKMGMQAGKDKVDRAARGSSAQAALSKRYHDDELAGHLGAVKQ